MITEKENSPFRLGLKLNIRIWNVKGINQKKNKQKEILAKIKYTNWTLQHLVKQRKEVTAVNK